MSLIMNVGTNLFIFEHLSDVIVSEAFWGSNYPRLLSIKKK